MMIERAGSAAEGSDELMGRKKTTTRLVRLHFRLNHHRLPGSYLQRLQAIRIVRRAIEALGHLSLLNIISLLFGFVGVRWWILNKGYHSLRSLIYYVH